MNSRLLRFFLLIVSIPYLFTSTQVPLWGQLNPLALPKANLTAAVSATALTLSVDTTAAFPSQGQVAIGTEVLTYTALTGSSITVSARGQNSTSAAAHENGSVVTFFPAHAALLTASIDDKATTLNINSLTNFTPSGGIIIIDQEIIGYSGTSSTSLTGLTRAQEGTTAAAHDAGRVIIGRVIASQTHTYTLPRLITAADNFSGLALINLSEGPAKLVMNAIKADGGPLTITDANNATVTVTKSITLPAHHQFVGGMRELLGNFGDAKDFYVSMTTGNLLSLGVSPLGNVDPSVGLNRLEVAPVVTEGSLSLVLPIALQATNQYRGDVALEIGVIGNTFGGPVEASFVDASGNLVQAVTLTLNPQQRLIQNLSDIFPNLKDQTIESGYVRLTSTLLPFIAYENLMVGRENGFLNALPPTQASTVMNIPLAISSGAYTTRLILTDSTPATSGGSPAGVVNVLVTAYNPDGTLLSGDGITNPRQVTFTASGQYSNFISEIFGLHEPQSFFGYMKVELTSGSSTQGFFATALLLETNRNELTVIPGQINPKKTLTLTPALFDPVILSGLSLINNNASTANVQLNVRAASGSVRDTQTLIIPPLGQSIQVLRTLFPSVDFTFDSYLVINSDIPIFGMIAFDNGIFLASGYPISLPDQFLVTPNPLALATPIDSSVPPSASSYPLTIQIPFPAPRGGTKVNLNIQNSVIATLSANSITIPEGQTSAAVTVNAQISGATVVDISSPGFNPAAVAVSVQNLSDFTLSRNVTLAPQNPTVQSGGTLQFTLTYDTVSHPAVEWRVAGLLNGNSNLGIITQDGFFTAPLLLPTDQPLQLLISATNSNTVFFGASTRVTVLPPPPPAS